ncbi:MAG: hypothetical protein JW732_06320 [Dehalococcoidia bacterium]|nr:hypothetical protein [Dehalococcoidia bacterium]
MKTTMSDRDDFPERVKRIVAQRAAYFCSRPECRNLTLGPHSDPEKALSNGVAAHICAASPGGPRFDPTQTEEERRSLDNAIWLCHSCSDLVDKDEQAFPKEVLREWKSLHDKFISDSGGVPQLPDITVRTLEGLVMPPRGPATIRGKDISLFREHELLIVNHNSRLIYWLTCRIQFPESIITHRIVENPAGSSFDCKPDSMQLVASATGSGSVSVTGGLRPALNYILASDTLPPRSRLNIHFLSTASENSSDYYMSGLGSESLMNYVLGQFQYPLLGEYIPRRFLLPLNFEPERRVITSLPCEDYDGSRSIIHRETWP